MMKLLFALSVAVQTVTPTIAWDFLDAGLKIAYIEAGKPVIGTVTHFQLQIDTQPATGVGLPVAATIPGGKTYAVEVPPLPAGSHTAKVSTCAEYRWANDPAAGATLACGESAVVAFTTTGQAPAQTVTVAPTQATPGQLLTIHWTCSSGCRPNDWIGIFIKGSTGNTGDIWWPGSYTNAAPKGTHTTPAPAVGDYEVRYCYQGYAPYNCPVIAPFTVRAGTTPVDCVVSPWSAWSAWVPISATMEQRTRTRTVITPAANGGAPCPPLTETETRLITPGGTKLDCTYALTFTVTTQNNVATVSAPVITGSCK
jgi:hypothetical protein